MAGFVTWAKRCLRKWYRGRSCPERTAGGVSSPIENVGSLPAAAAGARISVSSSRV
ncbi:hypothetical protein HRbin12_01309 [bacterium HR12]|nr:hypothetical protein HRbin12_01309 [bacterium HR12]